MRDRARVNRLYAGGTAGMIALLLALTLAVWWFRPPLPDPTSLCPTTRPIAGHTVVIVDRTDRWAPAVGQALTQLIEKAQRDTKPYEKFSIVALDADLSTHPLFSICNPGEPTFVTDLYRGRRYTKRDFDEKFLGAAIRVVAQLSRPGEAPTSPIVEYLHRWLERDDFDSRVPARRVILISDMRQNSPALSVYAGHGATDLAPLVAREFGVAARGVDFDVYFVDHPHDKGPAEDVVRAAWDRAFRQIPATYAWRRID
jgi:hypothetical protein